MFVDTLALRVRERAYDRAAKFLLRAAIFPNTTASWLEFLGALRERVGVAELPFDLVKKPSKAFVDRRFDRRIRAFLLQRHYGLLLRTFGSDLVGNLLAGEAIEIGATTGKSGKCYLVEMRRDQKFQSEGDLILTFCPADRRDLRLANLSLTLGSLNEADPDQLWIGGLQGVSSEEAKAEIIAATRDLWGMRPKQLLLEAAYGLAQLARVSGLVAVSNQSHVSGGVGRHGQVIRADYDTFWSEMGGALDAQGHFILPTVRLRRSECEVKPAKRKAWRDRYAMVDGFNEIVRGLPARLSR